MNLGGTKLRGYHYWWELVTAKQLSHLRLSQGISVPIYPTSGRPALGLPPLSQDCKSHHTDATQVNIFIKGWGRGVVQIIVWAGNHNCMTSWGQMNLKPKVRKLSIRLPKTGLYFHYGYKLLCDSSNSDKIIPMKFSSLQNRKCKASLYPLGRTEVGGISANL